MSQAQSTTSSKEPTLLSVIELGGYADFMPLYRRLGFSVTSVNSSRKAISTVKKLRPDVVVAEFNYQSDFRDRTSTLESLLASIERFADTRAIVFYEKETLPQLEKLLKQFSVFGTMAYPLDEAEFESLLQRALQHGE